MAGDRVECRSDHDYIGHPRAFYWQDVHLDVAEVLQEKRTTSGFSFVVQAVNQDVFILDYDVSTDQWSIHQL